MNLPFFKKNTIASGREYFFALEIGHSSVKSAIWSIYNDKSQAVTIGPAVAWDNSTQSLITACDGSLSDASSRLDPSGKTQPSKVILGLPSDWLSGDKILPEFQQSLKSMIQKLSLNAVGFVVVPEAAVKFLKEQEGVPPTAILMGFGRGTIEITLVRLGKIDSVQLVKRSPKVVDDVIEGLSRFSHIDMLPSRMLLYDSGMDLEDIKQALLGHPWQSPQTHLPFLHLPKIEILPSEFTIRAIAQAGGTEVALASGLISAVPEPQLPQQPEVPEVSPEDLGFSSDEEVVVPPPAPFPEIPVIVPPSVKPRLKLHLPKFAFRLPAVSLPSLRFLPVIVIIALILIFSGLFAAYWYLPKAKINLSVATRTLEQQFDLTADTKTQSLDLAGNVIPAKYVTVSSSADGTAGATGSKLIGDPAVGTVTIINGTSAGKSFASGTVITSPSGLKYSLNSEVQVASASGTADPNSYQPGKTDVNVTALAIGSDSNLSAGTQFRVGSYATLDYVARNTAAFSGGSSQQVKAVSKDDISKLRADVTSKLKTQAVNDLKSQVPSGENLIDDSVQLQTVSETFNHKEGDVADNLSLNLSVKAQGISFKTDELNQLISRHVDNQVPDGFILSGDFLHNFTVKQTGKDSSLLSVNVSASLIPIIDQKQIISSVIGKKTDVARKYLSSIPGINQVKFIFSPPLPTQILTLPHVPGNITVSVTPE